MPTDLSKRRKTMKTIKRIIAFVLVVCMLSSMLALTSCNKDKNNDNNDNDNNNSQNTYTVTVVDGDKNPVAGVGIMISTTFDTLMTDKNGKISFESEGANPTVMLMSVPEGYDDPKSAETPFPAGSKELTLTVKKTVIIDTRVDYTVTVKDQDGNPVAGVKVQLCASTCSDAVSGNDGKATLKLEPGVKYEVHVLEAPQGYSVPEGFVTEIAADKTEIEITVTKD